MEVQLLLHTRDCREDSEPVIHDDSHNGLLLYVYCANDTTLTTNPTPASAIAVAGIQRFSLC